MDDYQARISAAQLSRQFALGRISSYQLEDDLPTFEDKHLNDIYTSIFLDPVVKLTGKKALSKDERREWARIVLFLRSGIKYRWRLPKLISLRWMLLPYCLMGIVAMLPIAIDLAFYGIVTLLFTVILAAIVLIINNLHYQHTIKRNNGDESVWPFFTQAEYQQALQHPVYLAGKKAN